MIFLKQLTSGLLIDKYRSELFKLFYFPGKFMLYYISFTT